MIWPDSLIDDIRIDTSTFGAHVVKTVTRCPGRLIEPVQKPQVLIRTCGTLIPCVLGSRYSLRHRPGDILLNRGYARVMREGFDCEFISRTGTPLHYIRPDVS